MGVVLEHVRAVYEGGDRAALDDVSFVAAPGELVAVLGPNGAGKSTLLRVMTGLVPCASGRALVSGDDVSTLAREEIARRIAVVPQETDVAYGFSVREVVAMGRAPHQRGWMQESDRDRESIDAAIRDCDLETLAARSARSLSGGEKKRVAIARALCQSTPIVVLDEPTAALDVRHQLALFEMLSSMKDRVCIVAIHDLNLAAQWATRIVLMKEGRVVAEGTPSEVMTWARLKETFDADLYVGINDLTGAPFFLPMRR
jgi:iron complex transport system ATP-binding protein